MLRRGAHRKDRGPPSDLGEQGLMLRSGHHLQPLGPSSECGHKPNGLVVGVRRS